MNSGKTIRCDTKCEVLICGRQRGYGILFMPQEPRTTETQYFLSSPSGMERIRRRDPCQSGEEFFEGHRPAGINSVKASPKLAAGKEVARFQMHVP